MSQSRMASRVASTEGRMDMMCSANDASEPPLATHAHDLPPRRQVAPAVLERDVAGGEEAGRGGGGRRAGRRAAPVLAVVVLRTVAAVGAAAAIGAAAVGAVAAPAASGGRAEGLAAGGVDDLVHRAQIQRVRVYLVARGQEEARVRRRRLVVPRDARGGQLGVGDANKGLEAVGQLRHDPRGAAVAAQVHPRRHAEGALRHCATAGRCSPPNTAAFFPGFL
eukprot:7383892-Prymnesium_polylepis.1